MSAFIRKNRLRTAAIIAATLFFIAPHTGIRTATGHPDDTTGNAVLAESLKKGSIGELTWWGGTPVADDIGKWSSSHLGATGKPPAKPVPVAGQDEDEAGYSTTGNLRHGRACIRPSAPWTGVPPRPERGRRTRNRRNSYRQ